MALCGNVRDVPPPEGALVRPQALLGQQKSYSAHQYQTRGLISLWESVPCGRFVSCFHHGKSTLVLACLPEGFSPCHHSISSSSLQVQADVTLEDQNKINAFSRLNLKVKELEAQLSVRRRALEDYEEAENELMLLDEDVVPYVVGECFAHLPKDEVEERLQKGRFLEVSLSSFWFFFCSPLSVE